MDDRSHDEAGFSAPSHEGEGATPAASGSPEAVSPYRESPMFVDQDEDTTAEPEQRGGHDDTESPDLANRDEREPSRSEQDAQDENEPSQPEEDFHDSGDRGEEAAQESDDTGENEIPATCTRACRLQAKDAAKDAAKKLEIAHKTIARKSKRIHDLRVLLNQARQKIRRLERLLGIDQEEPPRATWRDTLRKFLSGEGTYTDVWKSSYKALNMSIDLEKVHPQVRFVPKDEDSICQEPPDSETFFARPDRGVRSRIPALPDNVIYQILTQLLTKEGLVHCFSRLDPYSAPVDFPSENELRARSTGLRGRLYISKARRDYISLTHDTEDPQTVLAALSVCRKWCWFGCHAYYGVNSFSFSSISEFGRWCNGTGSARLSRVSNLELTWTGGQSVSFDLDRPKGIDWKALPLSWLCEATSLKTLCIHISETGRAHIRRTREPTTMKEYMASKTAGQPNARMTRALRNCRGMDYIYQLRGLFWVRWYDLEKESATGDRSLASIRDQSFVIDVERVATQEKVPARLETSRLENLDLLFPNGDSWKPSRQDFDRIRPIYTEDTGYATRLNDLDKDASSSNGTISSGSDAGSSGSGSGSGSDSDSDDDDDSGPALRTPPGSSRRRRPFTPAPVGREDSSESERDDLPNEGDGSHHPGSNDDESQNSGSDNDNAGSVTTEVFRRRRLNQFLRDNSQMSE